MRPFIIISKLNNINFKTHFLNPVFFFSEAFSLDVPLQSVFELGETDATVTCTLFFNLEHISLQMIWFFVSTGFEGGSGEGDLFFRGDGSQSLDLTLDSVYTSDAGIYSCSAFLVDSVGETANISRNHILFIQSKLKWLQ